MQPGMDEQEQQAQRPAAERQCTIDAGGKWNHVESEDNIELSEEQEGELAADYYTSEPCTRSYVKVRQKYLIVHWYEFCRGGQSTRVW